MKNKKYSWIKDAKYAWMSFRQMETFIEKEFRSLEEGKGLYLKDDRDKTLLDGTSLLVNSSLGHGNQHVQEAIINQMNKLDNMSSFLAANSTVIKCSKRICELTDNHFFSVFFTNSGSEATDTAIKIIKKYYRNKEMKRSKIISLKNAFHGSSLGAMALTHDCFEGEEELFPEGFYQVEGPEILPDNSEVISQEIIDNAINKIIHLINKSDDIAAIYVELVQLSNGVCILPKEYVKRIYEICKEKQILFVTDEVATGFGRTGKMFAAQHYGVWPDIMTIGKGMSAGTFPIAGVAVTEDVFNAANSGRTVRSFRNQRYSYSGIAVQIFHYNGTLFPLLL